MTAPTDPSQIAPNSVIATSDDATFAVRGTGLHRFSSAVIHRPADPSTGVTQLSTDTVSLDGDLRGQLLYHVTSALDLEQGTLVNTGTQVFSGTVAGSDPVMLFDDTFRFDVDLGAGTTSGRVHLRRSQDAPTPWWYECDLVVTGTGETDANGDAIVNYEGVCRRVDPR